MKYLYIEDYGGHNIKLKYKDKSKAIKNGDNMYKRLDEKYRKKLVKCRIVEIADGKGTTEKVIKDYLK